MKNYQTAIGKDIDLAAELLRNNEVVAIPTETVYGLAANALNDIAVERIFKAKNRPLTNPLIVHIADGSQLSSFVKDIPDPAKLLLEHFSPGPLTVLLPKKLIISDLVTAGFKEVAVRIPAHPVALELLKKTGFPLAAPSANQFGYISPTLPSHVLKQLNGQIPYILDGGRCASGIESTIVGFKGNKIIVYRHGAICIEEIASVTGCIVLNEKSGQRKAPGMLKQHYSPNTHLILTDNVDEQLIKLSADKVGLITYGAYSSIVPRQNQALLSKSTDLKEIGRALYETMHRMDEASFEHIIVKKMPDVGIGRAINDRLFRAAKSIL